MDTPTPSPRRRERNTSQRAHNGNGTEISTKASNTGYPPMLASPRNIAEEWDTPKSSSSSTSSGRTLFSRSSLQARFGEEAQTTSRTTDDDHMVAIDVFTTEREKAQSAYEDLDEDDGADDNDARAPMLGRARLPPYSGASQSGSPGHAKGPAAKRRRRLVCLALGLGTIAVAAVAGNRARQQFSPDWSLQSFKETSTLWLGGSVAQAMSGSDGSSIRTETGATFVYRNQFGGHWNATPFSTEARAQAHTPPLSERWDYSNDRIYGVNIGGWLNLEPFITPSIFEPHLEAPEPATDEWTLSVNLGEDLAEVLEHHYDTFITEKDFADIAAAGLNWVRIPVPFWAIDVREGEPFLAKVAWKYFLKSLVWARKYGLRVNVDLHTAPGSQNGWNHSGRNGPVNFMNGVMGIVNGQRTLNIIRALAEFVCLPENNEVIQMFTILNEAYIKTTGTEALRAFYLEAYRVVRGVCGYGAGNGPMLVIHDGFKGTRMWYNFAPGAERVALESHRYLAFRDATAAPLDEQALRPCEYWGGDFNRTMLNFGLGMTGEWSIATNDCGPHVNGVFLGTRFQGEYPNATHPSPDMVGAAPHGACGFWEDHTQWNQDTKAGLRKVARAHMDAFQNWFYWTWKTGRTLDSDRPANPAWSYSLGVKEGYIPADPREAAGFCDAHNAAMGAKPIVPVPFDRPLQNWQIGVGSPEVLKNGLDLDRVRKFVRFPPPRIGVTGYILDTDTLPRWRDGVGNEGEIVLEGPRPEGAVDPVRWDAPWYVEMEDCEYLPPWEAVGVPVPEGACVRKVSNQA